MAERFRWKLADDDGGQPALFAEDELTERHVGKGEFRGLEFLHVNARRIINEVPSASRMPFRFTINAYRGCSHACLYCMAGDTPILMADGRTKALSEIRIGDCIYGTERRGTYRHYVATEVLAHWSTFKRAYRVTLEDGTALITSGDHRFLGEHGWRHVAELSADDALVSSFWAGKRSVDDRLLVKKVEGVEDLGVDMPMYDITTGTGDFIASGVVSHNCFARPTHEYLDLNIGSDFDSKIVVKVNAVERLRAELRSPKWQGDHIAMGTNTDPYQRAEGKYHLTRGIVQTLRDAANPFSILTKSTLILRDLDLLAEASERTNVRANFSIGTLDEATWKATEPGTPHPRQRVEAVRKLNAAGVECGVLVAPVIPGMSDGPGMVEEVIQACVDAGAVSVSTMYLHLRPGVREHFMGWLQDARPDLADDYARRYRRSYVSKADGAMLGARTRDAIRAAGGLPFRRGSHLGPGKVEEPAPPPPPEQLSFT